MTTSEVLDTKTILLTEEQLSLSNALITIRPRVVPGTNVIVDDVLRIRWYQIVTAVADGQKFHNYVSAMHFFNRCGVPD